MNQSNKKYTVEPAGEQQQQQLKQQAQQFVAKGDAYFEQHLDPKHAENTLDKALNEYSKALDLEPSSPSLLGRMAKVFLKKGQFNKAVQWAQRALNMDTKQSDAHFVLGYVAIKQQNQSDALVHLKQAVQFGGFAPCKSRMYLAKTYSNPGSNPSKSNNNFSNKMKHLFHLGLAALTFPLEKDRLPFTVLFEALPQFWCGYFHEESKHLDDALKVYLKLYERFPGLSSPPMLIADIYRKQNQLDEALYWYQKAIAKHPAHEEAYFQIGQIFEDKGHLDEAMGIYYKLLELMPKEAHLYCSLGNVAYQCQRYEEALNHYKSAYMLAEDSEWKALVAQSLGNLYLEQFNNIEAAQNSFQSAIHLNPNDEESHTQLGLIYFKNRDFVNARLVYEKALAINPKNPRLHSNLGYLRWLDGALDEAERYYKQAITLDPSYEIPYNNLGVIYLDAIGNVVQAVEYLEKAIVLNENYALAYYNLGRAYSFLGQAAHAARCFKSARSLNAVTQDLDNNELDARIEALFASNFNSTNQDTDVA